MGTVFQPNIVVCPKCNHYFEHNMVNGLALIDAVSRIDSRKRMYCRLVLDSMERLDKEGHLTFTGAKKVVLDNFNDFNRDTQTILGYGVEAE